MNNEPLKNKISVCNCCKRTLVYGFSFTVCECSRLCDDCFLDAYVIYNGPPIQLIYKCHFCMRNISRFYGEWLFDYTFDYFDTEFHARLKR